MKKEKEIRASFAIALPTAKVMATVHIKCLLVRMEKALNLWLEDLDWRHVLVVGMCCGRKH